MIKRLKRLIPTTVKLWLVLKLTKIQTPVLEAGGRFFTGHSKAPVKI